LSHISFTKTQLLLLIQGHKKLPQHHKGCGYRRGEANPAKVPPNNGDRMQTQPQNMPRQRASPMRTSEEDVSQTDIEPEDTQTRQHKRVASVYDAAASRVGFNGFLSQNQIQAGVTALKPEEVLLRRVDAPSRVSKDYYNADELLKPHQRLPDVEVVKAVHQYASDYYSTHVSGGINHDYRSLDETALLAFAILMEEMTAESLGENGDMVLVEPEGLEDCLPESAMTKHQVKGRVKPQLTPDPASSEEGSSSANDISGDDRKTKRRRHAYAD
jgi:hypothetical protein